MSLLYFVMIIIHHLNVFQYGNINKKSKYHAGTLNYQELQMYPLHCAHIFQACRIACIFWNWKLKENIENLFYQSSNFLHHSNL